MSADKKIVEYLTNTVELIKNAMAENGYSDKQAVVVTKLLNDSYTMSNENDIRRIILDSIKSDNAHIKRNKCLQNPYLSLILRDCSIIAQLTNAHANGYHIRFSIEDDKYSVEHFNQRVFRDSRTASQQTDKQVPRKEYRQNTGTRNNKNTVVITKIIERPRRKFREQREQREPRDQQKRRPSITELESTDLAKELEKAKFEDVAASNSWVDDDDNDDNVDNTANAEKEVKKDEQ